MELSGPQGAGANPGFLSRGTNYYSLIKVYGEFINSSVAFNVSVLSWKPR